MYISNNAYSGLNSLRGGLKHSYWSGSSLLDTTTFQSESGKPSCNYTISRNNFNELARVTKKYSLSVRVTGAADSSTGTSGINDSLNISRACLVATELE